MLLVGGGSGFSLGAAQLPGVAIALGAAVLFALGTVLGKRSPIDMAPTALTHGRWDWAAFRC